MTKTWCHWTSGTHLHHFNQKTYRRNPLRALLACADAGVETGHIRPDPALFGMIQNAECHLPLRTLLTCADQRIEGDDRFLAYSDNDIPKL